MTLRELNDMDIETAKHRRVLGPHETGIILRAALDLYRIHKEWGLRTKYGNGESRELTEALVMIEDVVNDRTHREEAAD